MARPVKKGLDYFPFDVDFFRDIKVRKLVKYQSGKALSVYTHLLCDIYRNGYYLMWDNELPFVISEDLGYEEGYINEVIKCSLNIELFSKQMFDEHQVLTSKGIQERYIDICVKSKKKAVISEFILINPEETMVNARKTKVNSGLSTQRKEKKSKVNESKENTPPKILPFDPSDFYPSAAVAFEEIKNDELFVESLLRIVHQNGYRACNSLTVVKAVKSFFTIEGAKPEFKNKHRTDVKSHLVNWINKNAKTLDKYAGV